MVNQQVDAVDIATQRFLWEVALITGASRGLGQTFARALAQAGADLAITSRKAADLKSFQKEMEGLGRKALALPLDVRQQQSIQPMVAAAIKHYGKIDILVNNAGIGIFAPVEEMSPEKIFEKQWVTALLDQVMTALEAEFSADGKAQLFKELKPLLSGETDKLSYNEISLRVGVGEGALRVTVCRLRQRYRELLRLEIANTVESPTEVDDEIRYLFSAVS